MSRKYAVNAYISVNIMHLSSENAYFHEFIVSEVASMRERGENVRCIKGCGPYSYQYFEWLARNVEGASALGMNFASDCLRGIDFPSMGVQVSGYRDEELIDNEYLEPFASVIVTALSLVYDVQLANESSSSSIAVPRKTITTTRQARSVDLRPAYVVVANNETDNLKQLVKQTGQSSLRERAPFVLVTGKHGLLRSFYEYGYTAMVVEDPQPYLS
jgi:hypothetical protein